MNCQTGTVHYKELTKIIKKRVKYLRNQRLLKEADEINEYSNRRKIEDMFRKIKDCDSAFKNLGTEKKCDPSKLKDFLSNTSTII